MRVGGGVGGCGGVGGGGGGWGGGGGGMGGGGGELRTETPSSPLLQRRPWSAWPFVSPKTVCGQVTGEGDARGVISNGLGAGERDKIQGLLLSLMVSQPDSRAERGAESGLKYCHLIRVTYLHKYLCPAADTWEERGGGEGEEEEGGRREREEGWQEVKKKKKKEKQG